jgi:hypothetical protein
VPEGRDRDAGTGYLEHLSPTDLDLLERVTGISVRHRPEAVEHALGRPATVEAVFPGRDPDPGRAGGEEQLLAATPFLVFAVAVHQTVAELESARFVEEWLGPRQRVPVFDAAELRDFADQPLLRLFLAELLASYTHVASGVVWTRTARGWRRQRFNELDPVRLAALLEVVPEPEAPGVYRRLGDLALFLTGVFPDHTARYPLGQIGTQRLLRTTGAEDPAPSPGGLPRGVAAPGAVALFEELGRRWYHLAATEAPVKTGSVRVLGQLAARFDQARRVLNLVTERYLFRWRDHWFPSPGG